MDHGWAKRVGRWVMVAGVLASLAGGLTGCASQSSYDGLLDANRSLKERNNELSRQNQELSSENQLLQRQRAANEAALAELERVNGDLRSRLEAAGISMQDLERRMLGLQLSPLDPETDRALASLASQYPDLIRYDAARGMLRFAADLTFNSGSDVVLEASRAPLSALANILKTSAAEQYEVMIVGHTDSQRISAATAQRHPTNVHLSAHRAISVRNFLSTAGVNPTKLFVAGWGEFRPAVPNTPSGNTPQNRRVEIYLVKPMFGGGAAAPEPAQPTRVQPGNEGALTRPPEVNK